MKFKKLAVRVLSFIYLSFMTLPLLGAPSSFVYEGVLLDSSDKYVTATKNFSVEIKINGTTALTQNFTGVSVSSGNFKLKIDGAAATTTFSSYADLTAVLAAAGTKTLVIAVEGESFAAIEINSVPYAMEASALSASASIATTGTVSANQIGGYGLRIFDITHSAGTPKYVEFLTNSSITAPVSFKLPIADGSNGQQLTTDGSGNLSWAASGGGGSGITSLGGQGGVSQSFAASASGTTHTISSSSDTHTLNIPLASGAGVTSGTISKTEYDSFVAKLGTATTFGGDVSGAYNLINVDKIKGKSISPGAYSAGQLLRYDGTNWVNSLVGSANHVLINDGSGVMSSEAQLAVSRGGTGQSTYSDGQLLIGNSIGNSLSKATLTSGSGSVITNGNGSITISSDYTTTAQANKLLMLDGSSIGQANGLQLNGATIGNILLQAPATVTSYSLTFPADDGQNGYVLSTNGSGVTSWVAASGGSWTEDGSSSLIAGTSSLASNSNNSTYNVAIGYNSQMNMRPAAVPASNISLGYQAMKGSGTPASNTGIKNIGIGHSALSALTNGNYNIGLGQTSLYSTTSGTSNLALGNQALYTNNSGSYNIALGNAALSSSTTASDNIAIGSSALGTGTLVSGVGNDNIALGKNSLNSNTGTSNISLGNGSLYSNSSGANNIAIGYNAGYTSTPANANTLGDYNIYLGYDSGPGTATQLSNSVAIGKGARVSTSNAIVLGDNSVNVGIGTSSPSASALLELNSTSKGLLLPRMSAAQRDGIVSPVSGLQVYVTDVSPGVYIYNGSWVQLSTGGGSYFASTGGPISGAVTISAGGLNMSLTGITNAGTITGAANITGAGAMTVAAGGTNQNLTLSSSGTGNVTVSTGGGTQFKVNNTASAVNYIQVKGATAGNGPNLDTNGTDANIDLNIDPKGTGSTNITGDAWVTSQLTVGSLVAGPGTVDNPGISFSSSPGVSTGIYSNAIDTLNFATSSTNRMTIHANGKVYIGSSMSPTARLHLAAGAASASSAPLKLTSGTVLTAPEAGAIEFDGNDLFYTSNANARQTVASTSYVASSYLPLAGGTMTGDLQLSGNAKIGIGAAPTYRNHIYEANDNSNVTGSNNLNYNHYYYTPTAASDRQIRSVNGTTEINGTYAYSGYASGLYANAQYNSSGAMTGKIYGVNSVAQSNSNAPTQANIIGVSGNSIAAGGAGSNVANAIGVYGLSSSNTVNSPVINAIGGKFDVNNTSAATITNAFGIKTGVTVNASSIVNAYGLYIDTVLGSTTYGVYQSNASNANYFNGAVKIGTTLGTNSKLYVNGTISSNEIIIASGGAVDGSLGNNFVLQSVGGSTITLSNPEVGTNYNILVTDATSTTYTISGCTSARYSPANGSTSGNHALYKIYFSAGNNCYIQWSTYN